MPSMKHNILPGMILSALAATAVSLHAQEGSTIQLLPAADTPVPKAVVDVLLAINTYHMNDVFQSPEKLQAQTEAEIGQMLQNSRLSEYVEFRIVGVHCYSAPDATLQKIGMAESLRNQYKADLVLDLGSISRYGSAGQAYTVGMYGEFVGGCNPNPQEDAYLAEVDVVQTNALDYRNSYTIVHELAHLLGGGHCATQNTQPWCGLYTFAAGAVDKQKGAVTLLTYESRMEHNMRGWPFRNLCVLSTPGTYEHDGISYSIGNAETDNRRCFLMSLPMVAGYREGTATGVLNDTPQHAFELPPLYNVAYYIARFTQCDTHRCNQLLTLISCLDHAPHMFSGNHFTRIWGSTANASHDTTPGTAPNVWYRITAPHTATYTAGFRATDTPKHTCRVFRKVGNEAVELAVTPAAEAQQVCGGICFSATQGDELYIEISPLQDSGVFNFFLATDAAVPALPDFEDEIKVERWKGEYEINAWNYAILNPDPADLNKLLQLSTYEIVGTPLGNELLATAALLGYTEHCRLLLAAGVKADDTKHLYSPLAMATMAGQETTAAILREAGATLDWSDAERTARGLSDICQNSCYTAITRLIDAGMPVDSPVGFGVRTIKSKSKKGEEKAPRESRLIHYVADAGDATALQYLLSKGAEVDALSKSGETALTHAARQGHANCVKILLEAGASPHAVDRTVPSALAAATGQGHADCVKLLLEAGAATAADKYKEKTPLMLALEIGNTACIELLLPATEDLLAATAAGNTTLMSAACMDSPELLKMLIARGADVNARALSGKTPLLMAAQHGRIENMRLLIAHGANVNAQDNDGISPLLLATLRGSTEATQLLLEAGADATLADKQKCTPLMQAARNGNADCVKILLEHGAKDSYTRRQRTTSLMLAASKGSADCVRLLLAAGSKINARDDDRMSPLCFAAQYGNAECVQLLIDAGAKVQVRNDAGNTPLMIAALQGNTECVRILLAHGAIADDANKSAHSVLMQAAAGGQAECVKLLLEHGAPINATTPGKNTALSLAVDRDHVDCVKLLLEHGANPAQKMENGDSLLHRAVEGNATQCLQLLCQAGAPIEATDSFNHTPLQAAVMVNSPDAVRILLQYGANVNATNEEDPTPAIFEAARHETTEILEMLLQAGADVFYRWEDGSTLLHIAALYDSIEVMEALTARGLDVNAKDNQGNTPLHLAASSGHFYHVKWLLARGADLQAVNSEGFNLYQMAATSDNIGLLKFIAAQGVDPHHINQKKVTALHCAAASDRVKVATYLLEQGFDPNAVTADGITPMMQTSDPEVMQLLLQHGADIHARDNNGRTALHYAAEDEHISLYSALIKEGADPNAKDNNGKTPFDLAKEAQKQREDARYADPNNAPRMHTIIRKRSIF